MNFVSPKAINRFSLATLSSSFQSLVLPLYRVYKLECYRWMEWSAEWSVKAMVGLASAASDKHVRFVAGKRNRCIN